ncbi:unnamed protein product, partial [Closterium sp. Yama58-4]
MAGKKKARGHRGGGGRAGAGRHRRDEEEEDEELRAQQLDELTAMYAPPSHAPPPRHVRPASPPCTPRLPAMYAPPSPPWTPYLPAVNGPLYLSAVTPLTCAPFNALCACSRPSTLLPRCRVLPCLGSSAIFADDFELRAERPLVEYALLLRPHYSFAAHANLDAVSLHLVVRQARSQASPLPGKVAREMAASTLSFPPLPLPAPLVQVRGGISEAAVEGASGGAGGVGAGRRGGAGGAAARPGSAGGTGGAGDGVQPRRDSAGVSLSPPLSTVAHHTPPSCSHPGGAAGGASEEHSQHSEAQGAGGGRTQQEGGGDGEDEEAEEDEQSEEEEEEDDEEEEEESEGRSFSTDGGTAVGADGRDAAHGATAAAAAVLASASASASGAQHHGSRDMYTGMIQRDLLLAHLLRMVTSHNGPLPHALPALASQLHALEVIPQWLADLLHHDPRLVDRAFHRVFSKPARRLTAHAHADPSVQRALQRFWSASAEGQGSAADAAQALGSRYLSDFEEVAMLGKGGFGSVVLCVNKLDGRKYAIKRIPLRGKSPALNSKILREVATLSRLQHQHVVRYYQAWFETDLTHSHSVPGGGTAGKGDAAAGVGGAGGDEVDGAWAWRVFRQVVEGLLHVHGQGIIHRDLTPTNLFVDPRGDIKIGDFGLGITTQHACAPTSPARPPHLRPLHAASSASLLSLLGGPWGRDGSQRRGRWGRTSTRHPRWSRVGARGRQGKCTQHPHPSHPAHPVISYPSHPAHPVISFPSHPAHPVISYPSHPAHPVISYPSHPAHPVISYPSPVRLSSRTSLLYACPLPHACCAHADAVAWHVTDIPCEVGGVGTGQVDMWSVGVVLLECWHPFHTAMERAHTLSALKLHRTIPHEWALKHPQVAELVRRLLSPLPSDRPSAAEVLRSDLMPPRMEDEALNGILRAMQAPGDDSSSSAVYDRVLAAIFARLPASPPSSAPTPPSVRALHGGGGEEEEWERGAVQWTGAREAFVAGVQRIFQRHGALRSDTHIVDFAHPDRRTHELAVRVVDAQGSLLSLRYDTRLTFARWVAATQTLSLKRFQFSSVFRRAPGRRPPQDYLQDSSNLPSLRTASLRTASLRTASLRTASLRTASLRTASLRTAASRPAASRPAASRPAASRPAASRPAASRPAASRPAASRPAACRSPVSLSCWRCWAAPPQQPPPARLPGLLFAASCCRDWGWVRRWWIACRRWRSASVGRQTMPWRASQGRCHQAHWWRQRWRSWASCWRCCECGASTPRAPPSTPSWRPPTTTSPNASS